MKKIFKRIDDYLTDYLKFTFVLFLVICIIIDCIIIFFLECNGLMTIIYLIAILISKIIRR